MSDNIRTKNVRYSKFKDNAMLPVITVPRKVSIVDLCILAGFAKSKSEARRMIEQGGIRINDVKVTDVNMIVVWPDKE